MNNTPERLILLANNVNESLAIVESMADEMVDYIETTATINCPVDTGNLQASIRTEGGFPSYSIVADAEDAYGVQYGPFVEYGTSMQNAQPFLRPAAQEGIAIYIPIIQQNLIAAIKGGI